jgi:hypothetical protein
MHAVLYTVAPDDHLTCPLRLSTAPQASICRFLVIAWPRFESEDAGGGLRDPDGPPDDHFPRHFVGLANQGGCVGYRPFVTYIFSNDLHSSGPEGFCPDCRFPGDGVMK